MLEPWWMRSASEEQMCGRDQDTFYKLFYMSGHQVRKTSQSSQVAFAGNGFENRNRQPRALDAQDR